MCITPEAAKVISPDGVGGAYMTVPNRVFSEVRRCVPGVVVAGRKVRDNLLEDDMPTDLPDLVDIATLAERLGDSERHIRRLVAERRSRS